MGDKKTKILFRGAYNGYNYGDDLLLISIVNFLGKEFDRKKFEIYIVKNQDSLSKLNYCTREFKNSVELTDIMNSNLKKLPMVFKIITICILFIFLYLNIFIYKRTAKKFFFKKYFSFIENLNIIHYIGGGYFTDKWRRTLIYEALTVYFARKINPNITIIGSGLGLGPINNKFNLIFFKLLMKHFNFIFVRENNSLKLLDKLKINTYKKNLGDDVLLLLPLLKKIKQKENKSKVVAINLKDFPDHNYFYIKNEVEEFIEFLGQNNYRVEFYCFGQSPGPNDSCLLDIFQQIFHNKVVSYNPYKIGWVSFIKTMSKVSLALGFAYHFNVIMTLLNIPVVSIYSGNYYKQKIEGVIKLLKKDAIVLSMEEFKMNKPFQIINSKNILNHDFSIHNIENLYREMKREYISVYKNLIK